jgi:hypothetical protein
MNVLFVAIEITGTWPIMSEEEELIFAPGSVSNDYWSVAAHICISRDPLSAKTAAQEVALARIMKQVLQILDPRAAVFAGRAQRWIATMVDCGRYSRRFEGIEEVFTVFQDLEPYCDTDVFESIKGLVRIFLELVNLPHISGDFNE